MAYIFLDESGDLGFDLHKKGTSRYFLITALFTNDKRPIEKIVQKTHANLKKRTRRKIGVLHAAHEKPLTRERLLTKINEKNCFITAIYLDKRAKRKLIKNKKITLYDYLTKALLQRILARQTTYKNMTIHIIASRRETNTFLNNNFKNYLHKQTQRHTKAVLRVTIATPAEEKGLQAVDFVSWAIFRKYEWHDAMYYDIFSKKIIEEKPI